MFTRDPHSGLHLPSRRSFLKSAGMGFGSLALASLLNNHVTAAEPDDGLNFRWEMRFLFREWIFWFGSSDVIIEQTG